MGKLLSECEREIKKNTKKVDWIQFMKEVEYTLSPVYTGKLSKQEQIYSRIVEDWCWHQIYTELGKSHGQA